MCLFVPDIFRTKANALKYFKNPKIAKKKITVYKLFVRAQVKNKKISKEYLLSPHMGSDYNFNESYTSKFTSCLFSYPVIVYNQCLMAWCLTINKGIHAYSDKKTAKENNIEGDMIIKCYIPKGAKYFLGTKRTIVSNELMVGSKEDIIPRF